MELFFLSFVVLFKWFWSYKFQLLPIALLSVCFEGKEKESRVISCLVLSFHEYLSSERINVLLFDAMCVRHSSL